MPASWRGWPASFDMKLFHDLLDLSPGERTNAAALSANGVDVPYHALRDLSVRVANGLAELGVRGGERVAVCIPNDFALIETALACSRLGAVFVPINPLLKARQVRQILSDCTASVLIAGADLINQLRNHGGADSAYVCVAWKRIAGVVDETVSFDALERAPAKEISRQGAEQDLAAILYTSGSTGRAKGVMLSHLNLVEGAKCVSSYLGNVADDRLLAALPLSFDYGLSQVTTALRVGACAVLTQYTLPNALVKQVSKERITGLAGVPTMWAHLAQVKWPEESRMSLRYVTNSGGALLTPVVDALRRALPRTRIYAMYGLTEAFRSTYLDPAELDKRPGSIGKAIPNQEVVVVRPDGSRCGPHEIGELVHRGSLVTLGYWNDPVTTAARFRRAPAACAPHTDELAVWSGDAARADDDGFLYFVGRLDDQIKTSGYRVNPLEIEEVIAEVEGVTTAVAFGMPDDIVGQAVGVAVRGSDEGADLVVRILQHCRRELPLYMVPSEIYVVRSLALTPNGKPDRQAIAASLIAADRSPAPGRE
jgi:acyl-CoA ligase (AMP-forming) (exosortase A-associated)